MANPSSELLDLEKGFWTGDGDYYRRHLDEACLVAFTEMAGLMPREAIAGMIGTGMDWQDLEIEPKGYIEPGPDLALLTYEAKATRPDGGAYHAYVSTAYVWKNGAWLMSFHQQTPIPDSAGSQPG